jgi:hypothetical protein
MLFSALFFAAACEPLSELRTTPPIQASSTESPRWQIDINRVANGIFRSYAPRCLDGVRAGHTVEFRNFLPNVPANVTSISGPEPLYSPNLVRPYNYVSPTDPANTLCDVSQGDTCLVRPNWSFWRYTFQRPGVYDWLDTNQGTPGRRVVDPYYGTVTFVGIDPDSPLGTVCVTNDDGTGCEQICCTADADCGRGTRCFKSEVDAVGRCLTPSG